MKFAFIAIKSSVLERLISMSQFLAAVKLSCLRREEGSPRNKRFQSKTVRIRKTQIIPRFAVSREFPTESSRSRPTGCTFKRERTSTSK
jgi:hypothetical protein